MSMQFQLLFLLFKGKQVQNLPLIQWIFFYVDDKKQLNLLVKDQKGISVSMGMESNQQLANYIKGDYTESESITNLKWLSENENVLLSIQGVVPPGEDSPFNKEAITKIANSIIQQRK